MELGEAGACEGARARVGRGRGGGGGRGRGGARESAVGARVAGGAWFAAAAPWRATLRHAAARQAASQGHGRASTVSRDGVTVRRTQAALGSAAAGPRHRLAALPTAGGEGQGSHLPTDAGWAKARVFQTRVFQTRVGLPTLVGRGEAGVVARRQSAPLPPRPHPPNRPLEHH